MRSVRETLQWPNPGVEGALGLRPLTSTMRVFHQNIQWSIQGVPIFAEETGSEQLTLDRGEFVVGLCFHHDQLVKKIRLEHDRVTRSRLRVTTKLTEVLTS